MALALSLRLRCTECSDAIVVKLPIDHTALARRCAEEKWFLSVVTQPGQPVVFGALCDDCAQRVHPPEVMKAAEAARQQLLGSKN